MNNNKFISALVLCAIIFGGGGYYAGTKKAASGSADTRDGFAFAGRQNGAGGVRAGRGFGNFAGGEIISIDAQSLSVKSPDGGSRIVFYTPNTPVMKMASGTVAELEVGKNITVNGKTNPDGSVTAESIQLRPAGTTRPDRTGTAPQIPQ